MTRTNAIKEKRFMLEVLEVLMDRLDDERKYVSQSFEIIGEERVLDKDGEPAFNDDGTPKMRNKYDYVDIPEDKMSEDAKLKLACINKVTTVLEKMI